MQFWFCETCGKRLTDKDLEEGNARNKKLKGIFCQSCAVGVMTVEMDAITDAQIAQLIGKPASTPSRGVEIKLVARAVGSAPASRQSHAPAKDAHPSKPAASTPTVWIAVGLSAALVVGVLLFANSGSHDRQDRTIAEKKTPQAPDVKLPENILPPVSASPQTPPRSAVPPEVRSPQPPTQEPAVAHEPPVAPPDSPKPPEAILPSKAELAVQPVSVSAEKTGPQPEPPSAVVVEKPKADPASDQFCAVLDELSPLLKKNQFDAALKLLDEKRRDPALAAAAGALAREKADIETVRALREDAVAALRKRAGQSVTLKRGGAALSGKIADGSREGTLALKMTGGPEFSFTSTQLDPQDVDENAPANGAQGSQEYLRKRGLLYLMAGETGRAKECFTKARELGPADAMAFYLEQISRREKGDVEAAVALAWQKAEAQFAARDWKGAQQLYEKLQREHAGSKLLQSHADQIKDRLAFIERTLGPAREISLDLGGGIKLELVFIPAGEFEMGAIEGPAQLRPVHHVKITQPFYIGKYSVTQAQYEKIAGSNPSKSSTGPTHPVDNVLWIDADKFCKKLATLTGKSVQLPTEAQWEYACRAGTKTRYYTGEDEKSLDQAAWYKANSGGATHPVGQKKPNAWGLYDMQGNISNMCRDYGDDDYYSKSPVEDPQGSEKTPYRTIRGSNFDSNPDQCISAIRWRIQSWDTGGFRVMIPIAKNP